MHLCIIVVQNLRAACRMESERQILSATEADWSREAAPYNTWAPSRALLKCIRDYQTAAGPLSFLIKKAAVIRHRFWSVVTGAAGSVWTALGSSWAHVPVVAAVVMGGWRSHAPPHGSM